MRDKKIKVYFILPTLFAGGAERVISFVSQNLSKEKFTVVLIVIGFEKDSKYNVDQVETVFLNKSRVLNSIFSIIKVLAKGRPDIVMSSISHLNMIVGLISILFPKITFIGRQASIGKVSSKFNTAKKKNKIFSVIGNYSLKKLDYIVCQSMDMKVDFMENNDIPEGKIKIIHNPITQTTSIRKPNGTDKTIKRFITVGRLGKIKGHVRLLETLSKTNTPYIYTIIGEGNEKEVVFNKIEELNLNNKIEYIPYTNDVDKYLKKSDYFLQGSYSEGFPNALLESCTVGVPVIAFRVPGGTKDIVENNINGYLVENETEFLSRLNSLEEFDPKQVSDSVMKKFGKNIILKKYEDFFEEIIRKKQ